MAALIREEHGVEVETTPSQKAGEFTVWVDGELAIKKRLPFLKIPDAKVLAAVAAKLS